MKNGTLVTYAQYNEDIILKALLHDVKKGFYVDVGANDPDDDSVTKLFYESGWSGINIEPIKSLHTKLLKSRPRDINLHIAIGDTNNKLMFREYIDLQGHSTLAKDRVAEKGEKQKYKDYQVNVRTLSSVFKDNKIKHIHFLKIDVEGFEGSVINGNNWDVYRPEVICIEANHITEPWKDVLINNDYKLFVFDGLNEYYISKEAWGRTVGFEERAVKVQAGALRIHNFNAWKQDKASLLKLEKALKNKDKQNLQLQKQILNQNNQINNLLLENTLTLKNRKLMSRIKRSIYGLTIDWYNYIKKTKM